MYPSWFSNLCIYCENLSFYYVFSVILSCTAVFVTWWLHEPEIVVKPDLAQGDSNTEREGVLTQIKRAQQEAILKNMTEEQLQEEREIEKAQLSAIFELLRQQEEKFQVSTMEELETQLRLYRN
ncbi:uncharacterized protein [Anabrus simplex]|uniref:uncharacterized protein n=1 Tax=Anabrus simplex TaxID=316456 RepID=UPI0034DD805B